MARFDNGRDFEVEATVIVPPSTTNKTHFILSDGTVELVAFTTHTNRDVHPRRGDLLHIRGYTKGWTNRKYTSANCREIRVLGHRNLPEPDIVEFDAVARSTTANRYFSVRGYVIDRFSDEIDKSFAYLALYDRRQVLYVSYHDEQSEEVLKRAPIGSEIAVSVMSGKPGGISTMLGLPMLALVDTSSIRLLRPAPDGLFSIPESPKTADAPAPARLEIRLQREVGRVLTRWLGNRLLLQTDDRRLVRVELATAAKPAVGDRIEALGSVGIDHVRTLLARAQWRRLPQDEQASLESPAVTTLPELLHYKDGYQLLDPRHEGRLLRVTGLLKFHLHNTAGVNRLLLVDGDDSLSIDCTELPNVFDVLEEGSRLDVTGICVLETEPWHVGTTLPHVYGFLLVPRGPDDIRVIATPPWWTPRRFIWTLAILLGLLGGAIVVIVHLQRMIVRRTRLAVRAQRLQLESKSRLDERTRLAAELHDYHAQNLTAIAYQLSAARSAFAARPQECAHLLAAAIKMLKSCRVELRRALWDLRNDALNERDFNTSVEKTVRPIAGTARVTVRFDIHRSRLDDVTAHAVLSILRELVANAANHGGASAVRIAGCSLPGEISFSVSDNGRGFDPAHLPEPNDGHFGLSGITERIRHFAGTMKIDSRIGEGTRITVTLKSPSPERP